MMIPPFAFSLQDIERTAAQLLQTARQYSVWTFSGGLGAGKTTLVSALCRAWGITDAVSSPTFALINEYAIPGGGERPTLLHMDWYRVGDAEEAYNAGLEDALHRPDARIFIEWPERAPELLQGLSHVAVTLENLGGDERLLKIERIDHQ